MTNFGSNEKEKIIIIIITMKIVGEINVTTYTGESDVLIVVKGVNNP